MEPNFSCPPDYSCSWSMSITQNIPANHVASMNMILWVVVAICIAAVLVGFAMALWEKWH